VQVACRREGACPGEPVAGYGADVATISKCKIAEATGEFSVAGYTTFSPPLSAGGKTRVLVLVENSLAVRANVKVIKIILDPAVQSV
jgi:hypothetical protein